MMWRKHDALSWGGGVILLKYIFFPFSTALQKQQKIFACFPEDKSITIYLDLQIQKVFTPFSCNPTIIILTIQMTFSHSYTSSYKQWE